MKGTTSKEQILKKIRASLMNQGSPLVAEPDIDSPIFPVIKDSLDICFVEEFQKTGGVFVYCENHDEFAENISMVAKKNTWDRFFCRDENIQQLLHQAGLTYFTGFDELSKAKISITTCECLIARFGTIVVSAKQAAGRSGSFLPDVHIVVAFANQFVHDIREAIGRVASKYGNAFPSSLTLITGPSRTADIEKTLVMGAHGPKELYVFFIDKNK